MLSSCLQKKNRGSTTFRAQRSIFISIYCGIGSIHVEPTIAMLQPFLWRRLNPHRGKERPSHWEEAKGGHRMVIQWNSVIKSQGYQPIWDNLGPFHEGQLVWAERVSRVWCMCYVGEYSLGLARGSYCDHNVVGTIWEIDVGWAKQLGSGQSSVADHADRFGVDRDLGLFGNKLDGLSDREWHQFAIFLSTIDEDSISFLSIYLTNYWVYWYVDYRDSTIHAASLPNLNTFELSQCSQASLSGMQTSPACQSSHKQNSNRFPSQAIELMIPKILRNSQLKQIKETEYIYMPATHHAFKKSE